MMKTPLPPAPVDLTVRDDDDEDMLTMQAQAYDAALADGRITK